MNNLWYHGTTATAAENIIQTGKFRVLDEEGSAFYVSRPGRVYISRDIGVGVQHGESRAQDGAFGVLQLEVEDPLLLLPDELEFGFSLVWARRDHVLTSGHKDRDDWELIEDKDPEFPYSTWAGIDDALDFHKRMEGIIPKRIWDAIDDMSPDDARDQEMAASIGDDVIDHLKQHHPDMIEKMIGDEWFFNYTTPSSNVIITDGWIGTLGDFQRELAYIDEEIEPHKLGHMKIRDGEFPIRTRGIGKGWHNDSYRHSLAARGVRTR